ncbi:MAG: hypothetical protein WKF30_06490 [Pyrinomonadaceae bacterium]
MNGHTQAHPTPRFVRRTSLNRDENRIRFCQIDRETIEVVSSPEASRVTNLMSKVYLRLVNAPVDCWEKQGVLRLTGVEREGKWLTAWDQLLILTDVASATAHKALTWLHSQGVIGYDAYRNGVGIRIFINLASSSIRKAQDGREKFLPASHTSQQKNSTSGRETPFKDLSSETEIRDININSHAPENGAAEAQICDLTQTLKESVVPPTASAQPSLPRSQAPTQAPTQAPLNDIRIAPIHDIVRMVKAELEPTLKTAVFQAAAREVAHTREWFENKALPKAVRIAQKESYNVLKSYGLIKPSRRAEGRAEGRAEVDRAFDGRDATQLITQKSVAEVSELADSCVALLELQGRSIDDTLADMNAEHGGWVLPADVLRVRERTRQLRQHFKERTD